jgi:hypothetical protein
MRFFYLLIAVTLSYISFSNAQSLKKKIKLFDGKTFKGWQGDLNKSWTIQDASIVGGNGKDLVPHNEFIKTVDEYGNYHLKLKFKLIGNEGFVNGGVQFHSQRISDPPFEMIGYQADIGEGFWASLYDESRRNKLLVTADSNLIKSILKKGDWNDYEVRTSGKRIQIFLNGTQTVDYLEEDPNIPQSGHIALQLHGGGKTKIFYKEIVLTRLPSLN